MKIEADYTMANRIKGGDISYVREHMTVTGDSDVVFDFYMPWGNDLKFTALYLAALYDQGEIVKYLLEIQAQVDMPVMDEHGEKCTPIGVATGLTLDDVVELLVQYGANPDFGSVGCWSPLRVAALRNNLSLAKLCIEKGVSVNDPVAGTMKTPLHVAAENDSCDVIRFLLDQGVDVDVVDHRNATALHYAAAYGKACAVKLFCENGARHDIVDSDGSSALDISIQRRKPSFSYGASDYAEITRILYSFNALPHRAWYKKLFCKPWDYSE